MTHVVVRRHLVFVGALLCIASCAVRPTDDSGRPIDRASVCRDGAGDANRQAPIVCVDDSGRTLSVSPEPVVIHDVRASDRRTPVTVHWFTTSGRGDLNVEIEKGCVADVKCDRRGHCSARTIPGSTSQCKYDVWITGPNHERLDPTVVISSCCS